MEASLIRHLHQGCTGSFALFAKQGCELILNNHECLEVLQTASLEHDGKSGNLGHPKLHNKMIKQDANYK